MIATTLDRETSHYWEMIKGASNKAKLALLTLISASMTDEAEPDDRELFSRYFEVWQRDTRFLSSVTAITGHPAFTGIVNMGGNAVPFILEKIERQPSNLVWALNAIFQKKIGQGATVTEACKLWIAELKKY